MSPWAWLTLGVLLAVVEVFAPGFFFLWLGIGAGLTALLAWLAPALPWQAQALAFAALAILSVLGWFSWRRRHPDISGEPGLNRRALQQVGAIGPLVESIAGGRGRMRLGDGTWLVTGPDLPVGTQVRVARVESGRLVVEPVESSRPDA